MTRITKADKELLIRALSLAIRDVQSGLDPDPREPDAFRLNAELMADIDKFSDLRRKLRGQAQQCSEQ